MVTYEAVNMLFQFGIFLATAVTAVKISEIHHIFLVKQYFCSTVFDIYLSEFDRLEEI